EVAVVGGGPAGCSAALAAAEAGADVVLIDDQDEIGGHLRYYQRLPSSQSATRGLEIGQRMSEEVSAQSRLRGFRRVLTFGAYEGGHVDTRRGHSLIRLRAPKLVVATGAFEYPPSFDRNGRPGIMLASGVRRLMSLYRVKPGAEAVICGCDDDAL